jgi:hypothetical protein
LQASRGRQADPSVGAAALRPPPRDLPAAGGPTLGVVPTLEICHCCQAFAPAWSSPEYAEWHIVITADGELLGVVCAGCLIDDELIAIELGSGLQPA